MGLFSAEINWHHLGSAPPMAWAFAFLVVIPMILGKIVSGIAAGHLTHTRPKRWLRTLPLGVAAMLILPSVIPDRLFSRGDYTF